MEDDNLYDFSDGSVGAAPARPTATAPARLHSGGDRSRARNRVEMDNFGAAVLGVADTVTFGALDEIAAGAEWLFTSKSWEQALRDNQDILQQADEEHGAAYLSGQLVGGFVPIVGWAGRAKKLNDLRKTGGILQLGREAAAVGAVQGAAYGFLGTNGDFETRAEGLVLGGALGGTIGFTLGATIFPAGGYLKDKAVALFRHGKPPKLIEDFAPNVFSRNADEATEAGLKTAKKEAGPIAGSSPLSGKVREGEETLAKTKNIFTGKADDELEDGALLTIKELVGDPSVARKAMTDRITKMTAEQAEQMAKRLEQMDLNGDILKDPHYRSILGIDIEGLGVDSDTVMRGVELLEEATEKLLEKAGQGRKTYKQLDAEFRKRFEGQLTEGELDAAVDRASEAVMDARIADHVSMLAAVQLSKARTVLLPEMQKATEGARERLIETVTSAVSLMTRANYIKSQAGRALNALRMKGKLAFDEVADDIGDVDDAGVRARVEHALKEMGDMEFAEFLARLRNPGDAQRILKTLVDPAEAKAVGNFIRIRRSVTGAIKSNLLTPASGIFNVVGGTLHDLYRNHWARTWAANAYERAGEAGMAMAMRFENEIANAVYWKAAAHGVRAMVDRIKWDHWSTVEKRLILKGKDASAVKQKKQDLLSSGYQPQAIREFDLKERATVHDPAAFNQRMSELSSKGGFATLWAALQRTGAVALHNFDAAATATAKVVSGGLDAYTTNLTTLKETYALSARYAWREAMERGMSPKDAPKWAQARAQELAEMPPGELLREVEAKLLAREEVDDALKFAMGVQSQAEKEARTVAFMDGPQSKAGKFGAGAMDMVDTGVSAVLSLGLAKGLITPYISTPTRILESGLAKYTPWGSALKEVQDIIARGGPEAAIETARMEMGSMAMGIGVMLGAAGAVTVTNGGWKSAANLDEAPANRINLPGGHHVEFGRLEPLSYSIAIGASIGQAIDSYRHYKETGYEAMEAVQAAMTIGFLGIRDATLEKSYVTGLRDALQAVFSNNEKDQSKALMDFAKEKFGGLVATMVPASGTLRQVSDTIRGKAPEMEGILDQLLRLVPVPDILPAKVDFFGEEVDGRIMGVAVGDKKTGEGDWLRDELAKSGIDLTDVERRDDSGFRLSGQELVELRKIRATEATNSQGLTLREALTELLGNPEFQSAPTVQARQKMFSEALEGLNKNAREMLEERNLGFQSKRRGHKTFNQYVDEGMTRSEAKQLATEELLAEGLPDPEL